MSKRLTLSSNEETFVLFFFDANLCILIYMQYQVKTAIEGSHTITRHVNRIAMFMSKRLLFIMFAIFSTLSHWGRVTYICVGNLTIIASDNGSSPSHYLNQCWIIVDWALRKKVQWKNNQNSFIFIKEMHWKSRLQNVSASTCYTKLLKGQWCEDFSFQRGSFKNSYYTDTHCGSIVSIGILVFQAINCDWDIYRIW